MARRKSKPEGTVYYINSPFNYAPQHQMPQHQVLHQQQQPMPVNQPPFPPPVMFQQPPPIPGNGLNSILMASNAIGDVDLSSSSAAYTLEKLKQDDWYGNNRPPVFSMNQHQLQQQQIQQQHQHQQQIPPPPQQQPQQMGMIPFPFVSGIPQRKLNDSYTESKPQRIFIHRNIPDKFYSISTIDSDLRDSDKVDANATNDSITDNEDDLDEKKPDISSFKLDLPFSETSYGSDIIFSNGNNREKRRNELFEKYSALHRYKEENRLKIFLMQKNSIEANIKDLTQEEEENIKDLETLEKFKDLAESRDYELLQLKLMRNYRRVINLKNYYVDTFKVYDEAYKELNVKLESLKSYLLKQKSLLNNLDRDFTEISSSRSNKFYSGFIDDGTDNKNDISDNEIQQNVNNNENKSESSETDTGTSSSANYKSNKKSKTKTNNKITKNSKEEINSTSQLLSSILSGFAPLLTDKEFEVITSEDFKSRYKTSSTGSRTADLENDEFSSGGTSNTANAPKKRGPRVRNADKDSTIMNKIMKGYIPPDDLKNDEIEQDLAKFRLMIKEAKR